MEQRALVDIQRTFVPLCLGIVGSAVRTRVCVVRDAARGLWRLICQICSLNESRHFALALCAIFQFYDLHSVEIYLIREERKAVPVANAW